MLPLRRPLISNPVFERRVTIMTDTAQRLMRREFDIVTSSIFAIEMVLRMITKTDEAAVDAETAISSELLACRQGLDQELAKYDQLLAENGITDELAYTAPQETTVKLRSPRANEYLGLLQTLDNLAKRADALWFAGVLDGRQHKRVCFENYQRVRKMGRRIVDLARRARNAEQSRKVTEDADTAAPSIPPSAVEPADVEDAA